MSTAVVVLACIGLFAGINVVGLVAMLLNRALRPLREIKRYADDILVAARGIERNLGGIEEATRLRELTAALPGGVREAVR
jgi:hypothetical protein